MNVVMLVGQIADQPELRYSRSGTAVCNFAVSVAKDETSFDRIPFVAFGKTAEAVNELSAGALVDLQGKIQVRSFEGKDGTKRWNVELVAFHVHAIDTGAVSLDNDPFGDDPF